MKWEGREGVREREGGVCVIVSPLTQLMSVEEVFMEYLEVELGPSL